MNLRTENTVLIKQNLHFNKSYMFTQGELPWFTWKSGIGFRDYSFLLQTFRYFMENIKFKHVEDRTDFTFLRGSEIFLYMSENPFISDAPYMTPFQR